MYELNARLTNAFLSTKRAGDDLGCAARRFHGPSHRITASAYMAHHSRRRPPSRFTTPPHTSSISAVSCSDPLTQGSSTRLTTDQTYYGRTGKTACASGVNTAPPPKAKRRIIGHISHTHQLARCRRADCLGGFDKASVSGGVRECDDTGKRAVRDGVTGWGAGRRRRDGFAVQSRKARATRKGRQEDPATASYCILFLVSTRGYRCVSRVAG
ncbi:hypothetical protein C8F01DRAFT_1155647 [Mycena amicta]|nr:hypothetical protein C8F01DRAFT_1155647 [Mycena amicta]